jgi:predicted component of type VI protein secretion system
MWQSLRLRVGVQASFAAVVIAIILAIFEVQGWIVPAPLAVALLVLLMAMLVVAVGMILYELIKAANQYLDARATSAAWVSSEAPGLLDYEADGIRANKRFTAELRKLGKDTERLGQQLRKHSKRLVDAKAQKAAKKQRRANQAARAIDKSAVFIEKRSDLLRKLVTEIHRNYQGLIGASNVETEEDRTFAEMLVTSLASNRQATSGAIESQTTYLNSVRSLEKQNPSRTVRIASKRLGDSLDEVMRILRQFSNNARRQGDELQKKINQ